ncbi:uncharacterized protein LOC119573488, partial [Penaeus monodon]|uniref:uncharacterized protein LOC119573488 n=1 Tax=Penaeus monodon TaxID=6687 RepID=UPI0018A76DDA
MITLTAPKSIFCCYPCVYYNSYLPYYCYSDSSSINNIEDIFKWRNDMFTTKIRREWDDEETPSELPAEYQRHQRVWLGGLTARSAKVVQVTQSRTANNHRELSVVRGEYLEVLDDSKNWWKVVNVLGQVAHVPHTIVKIYTPDRDGDEGGQQHPGPPPPPDPSLSSGEEGPVSGGNSPNSNGRMSKEDPKGDGQINPGIPGRFLCRQGHCAAHDRYRRHACRRGRGGQIFPAGWLGDKRRACGRGGRAATAPAGGGGGGGGGGGLRDPDLAAFL